MELDPGNESVGGVMFLRRTLWEATCFAMMIRLLALFVFACVRLGDAHVLSVVVPTFWDADVQQPVLMEDVATAGPERGDSREPTQKASQIQPATRKLSWNFPEDPVDLVKKPYQQQQQPVKTDRVAVKCEVNKIQVEVKQDLMGHGKMIKPEELTLGGCPATEVDDWAHVLAFESELHGCGSTLVVGCFWLFLLHIQVVSCSKQVLYTQMTKNTLIYAFALIYKPKALYYRNIIRSQGAVIWVECHYLT